MAVMVLQIVGMAFFAFTVKDPSEQLEKWLVKGLESGIKDVSCLGPYAINIYFNNGVVFMGNWIHGSMIYIKGHSYPFEPSVSVREKLKEAILKWKSYAA